MGDGIRLNKTAQAINSYDEKTEVISTVMEQ